MMTAFSKISEIKLCLTDDHTLFRQMLKKCLKDAPRIADQILEAENGAILLEVLKLSRVDVVILDVNMPVLDGRKAAEIIVDRYPDVKIIILTGTVTTEIITDLLNVGVHGILQKDCELDELVLAIYDVYDRDFHRNKLIVSALASVSTVRMASMLNSKPDITRRERAILRLICEEYTMKEISTILCISPKTVENHRLRMQRKLSVSNSVGLVKYAYQIGLLN